MWRTAYVVFKASLCGCATKITHTIKLYGDWLKYMNQMGACTIKSGGSVVFGVERRGACVNSTHSVRWLKCTCVFGTYCSTFSPHMTTAPTKGYLANRLAVVLRRLHAVSECVCVTSRRLPRRLRHRRTCIPHPI